MGKKKQSETQETPKNLAKVGDWKTEFIDSLRSSANVRSACEKANVSRGHAYRCKDAEPEFAERWADAMQDAVDDLQGEAFTRAKKESDTLLIFLLKCHRREVYGQADQMRFSGNVELEHRGRVEFGLSKDDAALLAISDVFVAGVEGRGGGTGQTDQPETPG